MDEALRAVGAVRAEGVWAHIGSLKYTSSRLENPNQGRAGGDNGRGVKAVSGGGKK